MFQDVTLCHLVCGSQCIEGPSWFLHLQGTGLLDLEDEGTMIIPMPCTTHPLTWHHIS
jgi:hypothetical protein